jgi:hypothetical protein
MRKFLSLRLFKVILILSILFLFFGVIVRLHYCQLVYTSSVISVYSINDQNADRYGYQLFRIIGRGKKDFILTLYLKNYFVYDSRSILDFENMDFIQSPSYSYVEGVWKTDFFVWCSKHDASIFISRCPNMDKPQLNCRINEIKKVHNNNNCIGWIVAPMGYDNEMSRVYHGVMCSAITGVENGKQKYQLMVGVLYQEDLKNE